MSEVTKEPGYQPPCPKCGTPRAIRVKRKGLMQSLVLHHFGLFPWECKGCHTNFMFQSRGPVKVRRSSSSRSQQTASKVTAQD